MSSNANTPASERRTVLLPANSGIAEGPALKQELLGLLESDALVVVDVSDIQRVDTVTLQLLFAFRRDRTAKGRATAFSGDSGAWQRACTTLNLHVDSLTHS